MRQSTQRFCFLLAALLAAPTAFAASRGAKYSAWLAAAFASEGRTIIGIDLAGINQETLVAAAEKFNVLDAKFMNIPAFLKSGRNDEVSTPDEHRTVFADLKRAGFRRVQIAYFPGEHEVNPAPLQSALEWFRAMSTITAPAP